MKIVIISSFFYPVIQPRSFRATELAKEFSRQGHTVDVITMNTVEGFDYDSFEKEHNVHVCHLNIFKQDGTAKAAGTVAKQGALKSLFRFLVSYLLCGRMGIYMVQIYKALTGQKSLEDADVVIPLSTPFCIHWALSRYIRKKGKRFVAIADSGDPFYHSKQWKIAIWFKHIEKAVYKRIDYLTIPTPNAIPSYSDLIPEEKIKIIPQGFDMRNVRLYQGPFGSRIRIAYAGVFYWDIRNPEFFFEYLENCPFDYELNLFLRYKDATLERVIEKYPNLHARTVMEFNIPHDDLIYKLSSMHFLVNIENVSNTQMPSKLIDYGMTKRPILSCNEKNFEKPVADDFMNGRYDKSYPIRVQDYDIVNIAGKFLSLV